MDSRLDYTWIMLRHEVLGRVTTDYEEAIKLLDDFEEDLRIYLPSDIEQYDMFTNPRFTIIPLRLLEFVNPAEFYPIRASIQRYKQKKAEGWVKRSFWTPPVPIPDAVLVD